jgi:hypothetical protein
MVHFLFKLTLISGVILADLAVRTWQVQDSCSVFLPVFELADIPLSVVSQELTSSMEFVIGKTTEVFQHCPFEQFSSIRQFGLHCCVAKDDHSAFSIHSVIFP